MTPPVDDRLGATLPPPPMREASQAEMKDYFYTHFQSSLVDGFLNEIRVSDSLCESILTTPFEVEGPDAHLQLEKTDLHRDDDDAPLMPLSTEIDYPGQGYVARPNSPTEATPAMLFP